MSAKAGECTNMKVQDRPLSPLRLSHSLALHQNEEPGSRGDVPYLIYLTGCYGPVLVGFTRVGNDLGT